MPNHSENIRSEEVQDILTKVPHWMLVWGNIIILLLLVLFFAFTWFIKYPDVISTEALITSNQPPQKEYAQASGKIDTLLVKDNEAVGEGEILAMIKNTASLKDVLLLKGVMDTIKVNDAVFSFPVDSFPILALGEISTTYAIFEKDYIDYALNKSLDPFSNQMNANRFSEGEIQLRIENLENQQYIDQKKFELSKNEFQRNSKLYKKGVISLNEFESKQLQYLEKERSLKNMDISLSQLKQSLNEAYKNSKDTRINHQMDNTKLFKNVIQSFTQLQEAIKIWELRYVLKSNVSGYVSFINIWNENQNVQQGDLLFTIIPSKNEQFIAKIKAPIRNSGKIKTGQKVNIKLLNFPETEYGMLQATVESMSAIPYEEGFYMVSANLSSKLITSYQIEIPFRSEMQANAEIITEDLRLIERFFYQIKGIFN
ncbi:MAG: HlyD family efflux transporter periplasmic adaptor subunit [Flavobacteriaceae bacterium]|nr:HlyD family efflux transporter periplasmic adaptor subunit [Flavobacteriaceae bacterium]